MRSDIAIQATKLSKVYRLYGRPLHQFLDAMGMQWALPKSADPREFNALSDVSLTVARGARVGLIGRNGAGKTTLLKLLTGNFLPTAGQLLVDGKVVALIEIGAGFHPEFSGLQNIHASLAFNGLDRDSFASAVEDVIDFCELGPFLDQPLKTYSLGMKSRLYFACATAVNPDILIIDEVLGAGDSYFGIKSAERMKRLTGSGCTLLLVSHSIAQIMQFCDDAVWLEQGRVVSEGRAIDVVKQYDEFIRELDNARVTRVAGKVLSESNDWLRTQIINRVVGKRVVSWTRSAGAGSAPLDNSSADVAGAPQGGASQMALGIPTAAIPTSERNGGPAEEAERVGDAGKGGAKRGFDPSILSEGGISRWPGAPGPKVESLDLLSPLGSTSQFITGDDMTIRLFVECNTPGRYKCCYSVLIFTTDLRWICRFHSPPHEILCEGNLSFVVDLVLPTLQLSNGEYIMTVGIFDDTDLDRLNDGIRYDNLSISIKFRVVDPIKSEQAIFHHPNRWEVKEKSGVAAMRTPIMTCRLQGGKSDVHPGNIVSQSPS